MKPPTTTISDDNLHVLRQICEKQLPATMHVCNLLNTHFKWNERNTTGSHMKFISLGEDWKTKGTFAVKYNSVDIFVFTLEKDCDSLRQLLMETDLLDSANQNIFYCILNEHLTTVYDTLSELNVDVTESYTTAMYWISKERALNFPVKCSEDVYIGTLNQSHVPLVSSLWPREFNGANEYFSSFVETKGGLGVFLKSNNQLVSWVLRNHWGVLVNLRTIPDYKRKGYGTLLVKAMCKKIAEEGNTPLATIIVGNIASEDLFKGLGFEYYDMCNTITVN
nr:uncharacterized protein LOC111425769 [Onthophagus taurus]XP_022915788.1 uncharacterized protein LOC111425769 [Onthophagus taurus]